MEQSPSLKANSSSANQGIPHILRTPKAYDFVYKNQPSVVIIYQLNPLPCLISILVLSSHLSLDLLSGLFHKVSVPRHSVNLSCLQQRRHVMGIDHVTACLQVMNREDGLQIRKLTSKVLNIQSSIAGSGCPANLQVGQGAENFQPQRRNTIRSRFKTLGRFIQILLSPLHIFLSSLHISLFLDMLFEQYYRIKLLMLIVFCLYNQLWSALVRTWTMI